MIEPYKTSSKINMRFIPMMRDASVNLRARESTLSYLFLARRWANKNSRPVTAHTAGQLIKFLQSLD